MEKMHRENSGCLSQRVTNIWLLSVQFFFDNCKDMNHNPPLISIVVAVLNNKTTLQQCIDSIIQQTYANVELIVIDGGSTDGTKDIIIHNSQFITYWVSEPDRGIYHAWNKALVKARGDWICFLGADDFLWNENVLESIVKHLVLIPININIAYTKTILLDNKNNPMFSLGMPWECVKNRFKYDMCIPHPSVMHRRSLFEKHGYFDESFKIAGDYELLLRELKYGNAFFIQDIILTAMRQGGISSSPKNTLLTLREVRKAQKKMEFRWPGSIWVMAVVRVYLRIVLWKLLGENMTRKFLDKGRQVMGLPPFWTKT
jgi:glycosyltransferase involved in cell wall biosynthesis